MSVWTTPVAFLTALAFAVTASPAVAEVPAASPAPSVQDALKAAVQESREKLGELQKWQQKLFDEEVVPQYQRFVRGYRQSIAGILIDVDLETLKKFLAFYGPTSLRRTDARMLVWLRADPGCGRCLEALVPVRRQIKARLERRGFLPVWLSPEELGVEERLSGKGLEAHLAELAESRNVAGALVAQWGPVGIDSIDSAHADEKKYLMQAAVFAREATTAGDGASSVAERVRKHAGALELPENESLESAISRLLTDAFTQLGTKSAAALAQEQGTEGRREVSVTLAGVKDFQHYSKLRAQILPLLRNHGIAEERWLARGRIGFDLRTAVASDAIREAIAGTAVEGGRLAVPEAGETSMQLEIR